MTYSVYSDTYSDSYGTPYPPVPPRAAPPQMARPVIELAFDSKPSDEVQAYTDLSRFTLHPEDVSIKRGRQQPLTPYEATELSYTLHDLTGDFDPDNPNSLFVGKLDALRKHRVSMEYPALPGLWPGGDFEQYPWAVADWAAFGSADPNSLAVVADFQMGKVLQWHMLTAGLGGISTHAQFVNVATYQGGYSDTYTYVANPVTNTRLRVSPNKSLVLHGRMSASVPGQIGRALIRWYDGDGLLVYVSYGPPVNLPVTGSPAWVTCWATSPGSAYEIEFGFDTPQSAAPATIFEVGRVTLDESDALIVGSARAVAVGDSWNHLFDGMDSKVPITAKGIFASLAVRNLNTDRYKVQTLAQNPKYYWPLSELGDAFKVHDLIVNAPADLVGVAAGTIGLGFPGPIKNDISTALNANNDLPQGSGATGFADAGVISTLAGKHVFSIRAWMSNLGQALSSDTGASDTGNPLLEAIQLPMDFANNAVGLGFWLPADGTVRAGMSLGIIPFGGLLIIPFVGPIPLSTDLVWTVPDDGAYHQVWGSFDGYAAKVWVDGVLRVTHDFSTDVVGYVPPNIAAQAKFLMGLGVGSLGQVTLYDRIPSDAEVMADYQAGVGSWDVQRSGERFKSVLDVAGVPQSDRDVPVRSDQVKVQAEIGNLANVNSHQYLENVESTEQGHYFTTKEERIAFRGHAQMLKPPISDVKAIFGTGPGELPFESITTNHDLTLLYNQGQVARRGGVTTQYQDDASVAALGYVRTYSLSDLLCESDSDALQIGSWVVNHFKDAKTRITSITVNPLGNPLLWQQIADREITDRIEIRLRTRWRRALTPNYQSYQVVLQGAQEVWTKRNALVTWYLDEADLASYWTLNDPIRGRLDAGNILSL